jgi:co-chaperonin GroES (HSP10)
MMTEIVGVASPGIVDIGGKPLTAQPKEPEVPIEDRAKQLPDPQGYRLLCAIPEIEKETEGGILKIESVIEREELLTTVLFVVKMGPDAYRDEKRFPSGPWCKEGDFVLVRPNAGTRVEIHGREFRIINDDSVEAVVEDPRGIKRK